MNIGEFITSINQFDLLVVLVLMAMFILGFIQGTIRRLLGIASMLFAFLIAANLREPLGNYLADNWTQFRDEYAIMLGFGMSFVVLTVTLTLLIQTFYNKVPLFEKYVVVDEVMGGTLGVVQGALLLAITIVILDSAFQVPGMEIRNELPLLREIHNAYDSSMSASLLRDSVIPGSLAVLGPFIPDSLRAMFPGGVPTPAV